MQNKARRFIVTLARDGSSVDNGKQYSLVFDAKTNNFTLANGSGVSRESPSLSLSFVATKRLGQRVSSQSASNCVVCVLLRLGLDARGLEVERIEGCLKLRMQAVGSATSGIGLKQQAHNALLAEQLSVMITVLEDGCFGDVLQVFVALASSKPCGLQRKSWMRTRKLQGFVF